MKTTLFILLLTVTSCTITPSSYKRTIIVHNPTLDTIMVPINPKKEVVISKSQADLINSFRQPMRDVAYYMITHEKNFKIDRFHFSCGKYAFWIANGYGYFEMKEPIQYEMSDSEKRFFWKLFTDYRDNKMRLYEWEDEIKIVIK